MSTDGPPQGEAGMSSEVDLVVKKADGKTEVIKNADKQKPSILDRLKGLFGK